MMSGPSPCSATCKRMPFVSIIRCVTSGITGSTQDVGSGPAPLGSAAAASSGVRESSADGERASRPEHVASGKPRVSHCVAPLIVAYLEPRHQRDSDLPVGYTVASASDYS